MTQTTTTVSAGMPAKMQKSRVGKTRLHNEQPLQFPLTCQHRRNISRRVEVYGSRNQRGSMTQTTTTVSAGMPARMQKSMDWEDAAPRCRRPLPFPLMCQHRRKILRRVEIYGSRQRHGSMTQTTTTVSAGMPARMQKSMDWGSDAAPRTIAVSADVPAQTQHLMKGRSLWIEEATQLHDADDHYCFRGHASKNAEV